MFWFDLFIFASSYLEFVRDTQIHGESHKVSFPVIAKSSPM